MIVELIVRAKRKGGERKYICMLNISICNIKIYHQYQEDSYENYNHHFTANTC